MAGNHTEEHIWITCKIVCVFIPDFQTAVSNSAWEMVKILLEFIGLVIPLLFSRANIVLSLESHLPKLPSHSSEARVSLLYSTVSLILWHTVRWYSARVLKRRSTILRSRAAIPIAGRNLGENGNWGIGVALWVGSILLFPDWTF